MHQGANQAAAAVHFKIPRRPNGWRADVEGEYGVVRRVIADELGQILWVDQFAAGLSGREIVETLSRLAVISEALVQMRPIFLDVDPGQ